MIGHSALDFSIPLRPLCCSQPHKHIQFVPLPLEDDETELPFLKLMDNYETLDERAGRDKERSFLISGLQYKHAYSPLPKHLDDHPDQVIESGMNLAQVCLVG